MSYLIGGLAFIFILGAAVVIHEFGHFLVAKLLGIRVETFSVGFGKRIWGRRWGTTDYRLSLIPLGGYVKLGGDESNAGIEEGNEEDIPAAERFDLRPRWQKFLVAVAGPVMNVLTALTIPLVAAMTTGVAVTPSPVVHQLREGGAGQVAGLRPGDRIISFNGKENPSWERVRNDALLSPEQEIPLTVEREGTRIPLTIKPTKRTDGPEVIGELGIQPDYGDLPVMIDQIAPDSPAQAAGLKAGDYIIALGGTAIRNKEQVMQYIQDNKTEPIRMTVKRQGEDKNAAPEMKEIMARVGRLPSGKDGLGIVMVEDVPLQRVGLLTAASHAIDHNIEFMRLTGLALGQVFSGNRSVRDTFSGPIDIARASSRAANEGGWSGVFGMLAFLSLNLGVFNLLPIPVLDGGMIFMLFLEGVLGWVGLKLSMTMRERIQQVGFVFLLLLMGFVIINDITKSVSRMSSSSNPPEAVASPTPQK
ncbi:MAG TPA: RIP metalloprotease RseP [Pyrinomonadaceae bacterium]|jgi:regulator of sigma E protease